MHVRRTVVSYLAMGLTVGNVAAIAQEKSASVVAPSAAYQVQRETTLIGTVVSSTTGAATAPVGAHLVLQTSSGTVDVHLGDARLLAGNHFVIQAGDQLRIIGENVTYAGQTQFVARIVQKGNQALAVRSVRGVPLRYMAPRDSTKNQGGVL